MATKIIIFLPLLFLAVSSQKIQEDEEERSILLKLKKEFGNPSTLESWNSNKSHHHCSWQGINCDTHDSVSSILLRNMNIREKVPDFVCDLKRLIEIDLSWNDIPWEFPVSILYCSKLQRLNLSSNHFVARIPNDIGSLSDLKVLDLSLNNLSGNIPENLFLLKNLTIVNLSSNRLSGEIPREINSLNMVHIDISGNKVTGSIPEGIGRCKNLRYLIMSRNRLTGEIPASISLLPLLKHVLLSHNNLSGELPPGLGLYSKLVSLDVSDNKLSGNLPENLCFGGEFIGIAGSSNNFTGKLPITFTNCSTLTYVTLSNNMLDGEVMPDMLSPNLTRLRILNLADNRFTGSIPVSVGSFHDLKILSLKANNLGGSIPKEIFDMQKLQVLDLSMNNLSGHIPKEIGKWRRLVSKSDDVNIHLEMVIARLLVRVEYDDVRLQMVNKGINRKIRKIYDNSSAIDLSCNNLEGNIPKEIGLLTTLFSLNMSHNHFSGDIPASIGNLSGLESLDLSYNGFSGRIPQSLATIDSLGVLDLSYNNLSGKIPRQTHFDLLSLDGSAFVGNDLLCGFPTEKVCEDDRDHTNPANKVEEDNHEEVKEKLLLYSITALGVVFGFWGMFFILLLKKHKWWFSYWRFVDYVAFRITGYTTTPNN